MKTILLVDDQESARAVIRDRLSAEGYRIVEADSGEEAVDKFMESAVDLVLMDVNLGDGIDGFEATRRIKQMSRDRFVPVICCTVRDDIQSKKTGLSFGADDYITKPFDMTELIVRIRSMQRIQELTESKLELEVANRRLSEREKKLETEIMDLRNRLVWPDAARPIIGDSPAMVRLFQRVEKIAPTSETVLITGATGVGKERIARLIHLNSDRAAKPFYVLDCPSVPESLFESELFGHKKGAFSGAIQDRRGILAEGDGATVLLDEITELPMAIQSKLLRFIQDRTVRPVGSDTARTVDVRILAATNRKLEVAIKQGEFRDDLYYRLSVLRIHVPSLAERREDIPGLAECFLKEFCDRHSKPISGFESGALSMLRKLDFQGNVRQLKNLVIFSATLTPAGRSIAPKSLEEALESIAPNSVSGDDPAPDLKSATDHTEKSIIQKTLDKFGQDRTRTAKELGITRQGLWKKMKRLGLFKKD